MGGFSNSPAGGPASNVTLDSPPSMPAQPSRKSLMDLGWSQKPEGGLGQEASNPQVQALQGVKMMEMGAQVLSAALPSIAAPIMAFVQQLQTVVPQAMAQEMGLGGAAGAQPGAPSPVPPAPSQPPGAGGGGAPM